MSGHPVTDLACFLSGPWRLVRSLTATDGAPIGSFDGTATVAATSPTGEELLYRERGVLRLAAPPRELAASRQLRYRVQGGCADVRFDDGRHFHDLDLRTGRWTTTHGCGADRYTVTVEVTGDDRWEQTWTVHGPAKAYVSHTRLTRGR